MQSLQQCYAPPSASGRRLGGRKCKYLVLIFIFHSRHRPSTHIQSIIRLDIKARKFAHVQHPDTIKFLCLSGAKLMVLDRMINFWLPKLTACRGVWWSGGGL